MPLMPAIFPFSVSRVVAERPMRMPPIVDASGVKFDMRSVLPIQRGLQSRTAVTTVDSSQGYPNYRAWPSRPVRRRAGPVRDLQNHRNHHARSPLPAPEQAAPPRKAIKHKAIVLFS